MNNLPSILELFNKIRHGIFSNDGSLDFNQTKSLIMDVVKTVTTIANVLQDNEAKQFSPRDLQKVEPLISLFLPLLQVTHSQKQGNDNKGSNSLITKLEATADKSSVPLQASSFPVDILQDPQDSPASRSIPPDQAFLAPTSRPDAKQASSQMEADLTTTTMLPQVSPSSAHPETPKHRHFFQEEEYERLTQIPQHYAKYPGYFIRLQK
ncbi:uncharacterized protein LOC123511171 [Portunus trituberculatus]|uniref:uncharacterized protein LOC123511171 n=1 Tax=Portunus trituberculatus TaxID=210409 RepID=UPI001E1D1FF4|nr:uncharacterized protein LOC123511171 [Portunus trituberculatus]